MSRDEPGAWATGGCACGTVRYRLVSAPIWTHCCHCRSCQRETGSAFAINAIIEADRAVVAAGKPSPVMTPSESGTGQLISRCPDCRVALWSVYGGRRSLLFVRAATLDEPGRVVPDIHIYTGSKLPWVTIPAGARSVLRFYDYESVWPAEAWARRQAALARGAVSEHGGAGGEDPGSGS